MFFNRDKTQSFEYRRNECCHKILDFLYKETPKLVRENTLENSSKGIVGRIISSSFIAWVDISKIEKELNEPDNFILDCCEHLELNKHIDALRKNVSPQKKDSGIIYQVSFTKSGADAYKTDYYLKENQKQDWATELHNSTIFNNRWSTRIAILAFSISLFSLLKDCTKSDNTQQSSLQPLQDKIKQLDSNQALDRASINLLLTNYSKTFSSQKDTANANTKTK